MSVVSMKQLLEAGVHFGHPTRKWNPKMKKYIYTARNDIYILDLEMTVGLIDEAYAFMKEVISSGKSALFVGTKKQAKDAVIEEAKRCDMFFMGNRWLGGTLTNFKTIRSRVDRLNKLNQMEKSGEFDLLPKKEVLKLLAERDKLEENLGGIKEMRTLPGVLFVVDPKKEYIAVREARSLNIPVIGLVDTNCDPDDVDYVIPGNDDAIRAVKLIAGAMADAVIEAREGEEGLAKRKEAEAAALAISQPAEGEKPAEQEVTTMAEATALEAKAEKVEKSVEAEQQNAEKPEKPAKAKTAPKAEEAPAEEKPKRVRKPKTEEVKAEDKQ